MLKRLIFKLLGARPLFAGGQSFTWGDTDKGAPWVSWSNETDGCDHCGRHKHGIWKHGRAWFHWGGWCQSGDERQSNCFGWEWVLGRLGLGASLDVGAYGAEHDLSGHLSIPGLTLYWHLDRFWPARYRKQIGEWWKNRLGYDERETSIRVHSGALWWKFWCPANGWDSKTPWWRDGSFDPADFFLGVRRCEVVKEDPWEGVLHLPEGDYPATAIREHRTWKRPRWPFVKRASSWDFDIPGGVPIPGKGENSWDCGEDAICGISSSEADLGAAGSAVVERILERRAQYGGSRDWRPEAMAGVGR